MAIDRVRRQAPSFRSGRMSTKLVHRRRCKNGFHRASCDTKTWSRWISSLHLTDHGVACFYANQTPTPPLFQSLRKLCFANFATGIIVILSVDPTATQRSPVVVAYGMGVDSTGLLIGMQQRGERLDLILFADTGDEKQETYDYLPVINAWLGSVDFPQVPTPFLAF